MNHKYIKNNCESCQRILSGAGKIKEYKCWFLEHVGEPIPVNGWLVLRLKRHGEGLVSMNKEESEELGQILNSLPKALKEVTNATQIYLCSFNESVPHLHFHFIPRRAEEKRRTIDFFILQNEVKSGKVSAIAASETASLIRNIKIRLN
ncbi:MAG: hypothetical protein A2528_01745 [Candidatus Staskawiczbacteria bacterium RIFOXYD2_FULL_37_9]|uniref:HIT domain-containing protein n=1 Tax=Candidatus Staskawiczbacteria bacterium RIFOXYB1_FULL_37_44 TaxID=1802223 RepID=A0A1G2IXP4_9BACT|nr:MAG: hypothetical protein A2358_01420 [Candidatus Staskawiczbacteria bacterium RIFOXYB1_FULL_37_44]OGZ83366.1 MAG: hypothetical protein A2416_02155 [Candidatus Staskawiczbacteria bacterium RIFOXYC1_FULL_37_52]OGZ86915.1 MAG: hypothetical protein A2444_01025 [Candidatus Staskawiczbacteria bacterium RIFOXYC2_FULL_37_19]OGZ88769.1 MAG: hypothetical protein A2581_03095 [Candidatus Staskawiczbacteria bacterium RIFOXYD1_FULL_37_110]OGZ93548.1 MAG: hypothetical protein A2528_01745 [Candidatus Stask